ncbi:hypothetical protein K503DRAFT_869803 [Rhizopogon vinicolor AM-OR11-026]|uniref:Uncharacterized protein n=1 Tax=Rhizopogon vinicolor AM-OR11-026 TaxID=1314800 RepID=A0A1B7MKB8_9AGAM|nr:hypothetical protein K503DRAFT_869803 [Rhizopogon vinicolor AM-OR11-026]
MSPEHVHQDATHQDHSRIPSQPQPSPIISLEHKTLHENAFRPNHPGLGVHHREQSRAPEQPMSPFQEQPNNAIQEGRKHVRSRGVERSTSYMAPRTQSPDDGSRKFLKQRSLANGAGLVAEVQQLSITTNQLLVTSQDLVASNKKPTTQAQAADEAIESLKQDLSELSDQTKQLKKPQAVTKNISNEHPRLKVNKRP